MKRHPKKLTFCLVEARIYSCFKFLWLLLPLLSIINYQLSTVYAQQPTEEWVKRFSWENFASGISVKQDSSGNVYVLMKLYTDSTLNDFGLVKYSNSGNLIWSAYYNSPGNLNDAPVAFAVTGNGNVYITGHSSINFTQRVTTVKFNADGILQWVKIYNGGWPGGDAVSDLTLDKNGNVIITGGTFISNSLSVALAVKYAPNGDTLWVRRYDQIPNYSVMLKVITDNLNNVYIAGYYTGTSSDFLVLKYNSNGVLDWYATYNSPQSYTDIADYLALDSSGNLYVLGTTHVTGFFNNNVLVKINNSGITQWSRIFTGILQGDGRCGGPAGVVISSDGSKIFYATVCEGQNSAEFVTLLYNSVGDTIWTRRYPIGGVGIPQNNPSALILDKYNNIYVTGYASFQASSADMITIKYLSNGVQQWVATYNGPLNSFDYSYSITIDTNTNLYITGISRRQNMPTAWDAVTIKYSQPLGIISNYNELPDKFMLYQNYPNPFNPVTKIKFSVLKESITQLKIYDVLGRVVAIPVNKKLKANIYEVDYDASGLASGIYFYSLFIENTIIGTRKFVLMK